MLLSHLKNFNLTLYRSNNNRLIDDEKEFCKRVIEKIQQMMLANPNQEIRCFFDIDETFLATHRTPPFNFSQSVISPAIGYLMRYLRSFGVRIGIISYSELISNRLNGKEPHSPLSLYSEILLDLIDPDLIFPASIFSSITIDDEEEEGCFTPEKTRKKMIYLTHHDLNKGPWLLVDNSLPENFRRENGLSMNSLMLRLQTIS